MRALGVALQVVAGVLGLAAAMLLVLASLGFLVEGDDAGFAGLDLLLSGASVLVYASVITSAPSVWRSPRRRRLLGGVLLTMLLSGGAGGMVLYAPPALLLLVLIAAPNPA